MSGSALADAVWRRLDGVDRTKLSEARQQAHHAVQWLARAARAYVPARPDDGHTNLDWDGALDGFVTHPLPDGTRLCLKISDLMLALHNGKEALEFPLNGRTEKQVRQWLGERLAARSLDPSALDAPLRYAPPEHPLDQNASYDAADLSDALAELAAWFNNAEASLRLTLARMTDRELDASDVRCWPHHFDLAALITLPARKGETGYVGAGLSPGDGYYDEPYFYVSVYPRPDPATLPRLPKLGHWHTHEFTAAVLPAHQILATKNRAAETEDFLRIAVDRAIKVLK